MKKLARSVGLGVAAVAVAAGLVAVAPAPSNALSKWDCPACRSIPDDSSVASFDGF